MNLFGIAEAQYYCNTYAATPGPPDGSLKAYVTTIPKGMVVLREGTTGFAGYRDCALRDVERSLFLAISQYRRAPDLMIASSSNWAHVTLYYGTFFAANALLGLFGGFVDGRTVIDVATNAPGSQELRVDRAAKSNYKGSHRTFWDFFYGAVPPLVPWVDPALSFALQPVLGSVTWLADSRNDANYDTHAACQLIATFQSGFRARRFPGSLPGPMNTQFRIVEAMVQIACSFAAQFGLMTDALGALRPIGTRREKIRELIFTQRAPILHRRIRKRQVLV